MTEESLFAAALKRDDPADRAAFLRSSCAGDDALRRRLEALLSAHEKTGDFLLTPDPDPDPDPSPDLEILTTLADGGTTPHPPALPATSSSDFPSRPFTEGPGTVIGPYTLKEKIGEGGMGVVYLAEQTVPVRRTVALKVIKPGMDTDQVVSRFEAERQALAMMDHPSIARVLDAGATDSGRPYFVMEHVSGEPITGYCDRHRLTPSRRLELLIHVCQAVQHAHQKGIIHRDLKPSNVLVALVDGQPVPKVIDFGIAKAIDSPLTGRTLTQHGAVVGTPEYMSPEQAGASPDIDTRTDVYALGVILYELLTGSTPLQRESLRVAGLLEILRRVREEDPPRPSTRLSDSGERLPSISAVRGIEPARLPRLVRGDLDWIVMKAIDKDRARRYESPSAFALDIRRHLDGDPVLAGPPSRTYRLGKFARKHRAALSTAATFTMLLVSATAFSAWQAYRATEAEHATGRANTKAIDALKETKKSRDDAFAALGESQKARAEAVDAQKQAEKTLSLLVETFGQPSPDRGGADVRVVDVLDGAEARLDKDKDISPTVKATLLAAIGMVYAKLQVFPKAESAYKKALSIRLTAFGPDHLDTISSRGSLADLYLAGLYDRPELGLPLLEENLRRQEAIVGPDHIETKSSRKELFDAYRNAGRIAELVALREAELKRLIARFRPGSDESIEARRGLALDLTYAEPGRHDQAIGLLKENIRLLEARLGPDHDKTFRGREHLAGLYGRLGRTGEAIDQSKEILGRRKARPGESFDDLCRNTRYVAKLLVYVHRTAEAIDFLDENLRFLEGKLRPVVDPKAAGQAGSPGDFKPIGRSPGVIAALEEPVTLYDSMRYPMDENLSEEFRNNRSLADLFNSIGLASRAIPLLEKNLGYLGEKLGADNDKVMDLRFDLAQTYHSTHQSDDAIRLLEENQRRRKKADRKYARGGNAAFERSILADCYEARDRVPEAIVLREENLRFSIAVNGPSHFQTQRYRDSLADAFRKAGNRSKEIVLREEMFASSKATGNPSDISTQVDRRRLAMALQDVGRLDEAFALMEEEMSLKPVGDTEGETLLSLPQRQHLASLYESAGRWDRAEAHRRKVVEVSRSPRFQQQYRQMMKRGAQFDIKTRSDSDAESELRLQLAGSLVELARNLLKQRKFVEAEAFGREACTLCETLATQNPKAPLSRLIATSIFGAILNGQAKYAEAEPMLIQGFEEMMLFQTKQPADAFPGLPKEEAEGMMRAFSPELHRLLAEVGAEIIQLYDSWGKPEKAAEWRAKLWGPVKLPADVFAD